MSAEPSAGDVPDSSYSAESFTLIREKWIDDKMKAKITEYTTQHNLKIFLGTWNVNAKKPSDEKEDLGSWLLTDQYPDIYVIGFQEIVDLTAVNLVSDHNAAAPWERNIEAVLQGQYYKVSSQHLVGLSMTVYVKREYQNDVSCVAHDTVGVGIMGVGGNKGGVGIRFQIFNSTVCIVNSHLAAHKNNVVGRNSDYKNICDRMRFPNIKGPAFGSQTLFEHDHVFWIGDLNYRLTCKDLELVHQRVADGDWMYLLAHDQLISEKAAGNAFENWEEGKIDFAPTYKYEPGSDRYERRPDKKQRFPAWCDRIQWIPTDAIAQQFYQRAELKCSDHKPVSAFFDMRVTKLVPTQMEEVRKRLIRDLDKWENEAIPKVALSVNSVQFPNVKFDSTVSQTLTVTNTGQSIVKFRFEPKLQEEAFCKKWLTVVPNAGLLAPEQRIDIALTVNVKGETAQKFNTEEDTFDDILILRLEKGRDYFITVTGDYLKSCFGSTIEYLVKTRTPVRHSSPATEAKGQSLSIPKELWHMVDYVYRYGMDEEGLFLESGDPVQIESIRECLDTGQAFNTKFDCHSMAECLMRFLNSLAEPVMPAELVAQYTESMPLTAWCMQGLVKLPSARYNTFVYVVSFLREVLTHRQQNGLDPDHLASLFARCLMHTDGPITVRSKEMRIMRHFLTSSDFE